MTGASPHTSQPASLCLDHREHLPEVEEKVVVVMVVLVVVVMVQTSVTVSDC